MNKISIIIRAKTDERSENMCTFALKGCIVDSQNTETLRAVEDGYLVVENGLVAGVFSTLPAQYGDIPVEDCTGKLIIPGMSDLHVHASQHRYRASGMDLELLDWLETYTFAEEAKYKDVAYAAENYRRFADDILHSTTTRACIFATVHKDATLSLMDIMEQSGLVTYVGKLNMDRNCPDYLSEGASSLPETEKWLQEAEKRQYRNTKPILTPRFIPSCTDETLRGLGELRKKYGVAVQSHMSENLSEIAWVKELCPYADFYGDAYDKNGLLRGETPCVMAHCVYSCEQEQQLMKEGNVFIAHSPESNCNVSSGVAPISAYLKKGLKVGLASDVAGGSTVNLMRAIVIAIQSSKLRWRLLDQSVAALTFPQAFYLSTRGGGEFFGKVGAFEEGFEADIVVLDDSKITPHGGITPEVRLERTVYLGDDRNITAKYVRGKKVL